MTFNAHWSLVGDDSDSGKVRKGFATGVAAWEFLDTIPNLSKGAVFDDHSMKRFPRPADPVDPYPSVYLYEHDKGTPNACWVVCSKGDRGAVEFQPVEAQS